MAPSPTPRAAPPPARAPQRLRPRGAVLLVLVPVVVLVALAWLALDAWSRRTPTIAPRHRAEALCFLLARPPVFSPAMTVEPSAAQVHQPFAPGTPASLALREVMHFDESMVLEEHTGRVGDFDVTSLWLVLPPGETARHWLVIGWMENGQLEACTFRFAGVERELSADERAAGDELLGRLLTPDDFRAGELPRVTLRATDDGTLPVFGPD